MPTTPAQTVTDLPVAPATIEERKAKAMEEQAAALARQAAAGERIASAAANAAATPPVFSDYLPMSPEQARAKRFERMLQSCVEARVATTVEGFVNFARELCDACDREFPTPPTP